MFTAASLLYSCKFVIMIKQSINSCSVPPACPPSLLGIPIGNGVEAEGTGLKFMLCFITATNLREENDSSFFPTIPVGDPNGDDGEVGGSGRRLCFFIIAANLQEENEHAALKIS